MRMTYIKNGETLSYDAARCTGCRECVEVCPHAVIAMRDGKATVVDREACMECGACAQNCAAGAIRVTAGVGCASAVIQGMIRGTQPTCGCGGGVASSRSSCGGATASSGSSCCGN